MGGLTRPRFPPLEREQISIKTLICELIYSFL